MHTLALDATMTKLFYPFSPFFNLLLMDEPYAISRNASMTDPIVASISSWIESEKLEEANEAKRIASH